MRGPGQYNPKFPLTGTKYLSKDYQRGMIDMKSDRFNYKYVCFYLKIIITILLVKRNSSLKLLIVLLIKNMIDSIINIFVLSDKYLIFKFEYVDFY